VLNAGMANARALPGRLHWGQVRNSRRLVTTGRPGWTSTNKRGICLPGSFEKSNADHAVDAAMN
jgi:hypothetical protein